MPLLTRHENRQELFNEWMILSCSVSLILYTEWISDNELKFKLGWVIIGLTIFVTLINFVNIFYHTGRSMMLLFKKNKEIIKRWYSIAKPKIRERYELLKRKRESLVTKEGVNTEEFSELYNTLK